MNEKVDFNNIIEVSHTKHTKKPKDSNSDDDEEDDSFQKSQGVNEEDKKYHENVISDVYGSISSEEDDDDEEEESKKLDQQIEEEAKLKEQEIKKQHQSQVQVIKQQVMDKVSSMFDAAKSKVQEEVKTDKVKVMFSNAFNKFNDIVQKNKANLPNIDQLLKESAPRKSTLNDYLKKNQQLSQKHVGDQTKGQTNVGKPKHFKIDEEGQPTDQHHQASEGEEFSDSEDHEQNTLQKENQNQIEEEMKEASVDESLSTTADLVQSKQNDSKNWSEILKKGSTVDIVGLKIYPVKIEPKTQNVITVYVLTYESRLLALVDGHLYQLKLVSNFASSAAQQLKEINTEQIKRFATNFFQKSKEKFLSLKGNQQSQPNQASLQNPPESQTQQQEPVIQKQMAVVKSQISLERLFMIDIVERTSKEIEVILHFVNKEYNPMKSPEIKRFRMNIDQITQEFLVNFEREVGERSNFYSRVQSMSQSMGVGFKKE